MSGIISFLLFCVFLVICIVVGGVILQFVFIILAAIAMGVTWVLNKLFGKE